MAKYIRAITTPGNRVSLFNGDVILEPGETVRISTTRFNSSQVQNEISSGNLKEVPSFGHVENLIQDQWDMASSTALPSDAKAGYVYEVTSAATHPSSGDSFEQGDLAAILSDGTTVRNLTRSFSGGTGGTGQYNWKSINSTYNANVNEYLIANTGGGSFSVILPATPSLGDVVGFYPSPKTFDSNPLTVVYNGNPIEATSENLEFNDNIGATLVFVGGTVGWAVIPLDDSVVFIQDLQADSYYTIKLVGSPYTAQAEDSGKILVFDTLNSVTLDLPENSTEVLPQGYYVSFRNKQGGPITLSPNGSDTVAGSGIVTNDSTILGTVYLEEAGSPNLWISIGDLS